MAFAVWYVLRGMIQNNMNFIIKKSLGNVLSKYYNLIHLWKQLYVIDSFIIQYISDKVLFYMFLINFHSQVCHFTEVKWVVKIT